MGWLGWSRHEAWHTPIPEIMLAMDWRIDWAQKTNPFGGGEKKTHGKAKKPSAEDIRKAFEGYGVRKVKANEQ